MSIDYDAHEALAEQARRRVHLTAVTGRMPLEMVRGCQGASCRQGRMPCRENCGAEMACTTGEDLSEGNAIWLGLGIAGALVLVVCALAYTFADPLLALLRMALN